MEYLEGTGLIELAKKKDLINFDTMKRSSSSKDPFLEDEGFLPSDISGNTTPRRTSAVGSNKSLEKIGKLDHSLIETPKRTVSTHDIQNLQKNALTIAKLASKQEVPSSSGEQDRKAESQNPTAEIKVVETKIAPPTSSLFSSSRSKELQSIFGVKKPAAEPTTGNELKAGEESKEEQPKPATEEKKEPKGIFETKEKDEDKVDKPKLKSIFGPPQSTIEELRQGRSSNNSSPSFGESKNVANGDATVKNKPIHPKPISLFHPKESIIAESPLEEDQANQEECESTTPKPNLFEKRTVNIVKPKETIVASQTAAPNTGALNPFLISKAEIKPKNLFGKKEEPSSEQPKVSILGGATTSIRGSIFGPQKTTPIFAAKVPDQVSF